MAAHIRFWIAFSSMLICVLTDNPHEEMATNQDCQNVAKKISALKMGNPFTVPQKKMHDQGMALCYKGTEELHQSCCTRKMEKKFQVQAEQDYSHTVGSSTSFLKLILVNHVDQFTEKMQYILMVSQNNTETSFNQDFKPLPADVLHGPIDNLFLDLNAYFHLRDVDIHETISTFFNEIFPLVVEHLVYDASRMVFNVDYRDCLMEARQSIIPRPFGDAPNNLAQHLRKQLGLARLYFELLNLGIEALNTTDNLRLDTQCSEQVTRLSYCALCEGYTDVQPCKGFCENIMRGCMSHITKLDTSWNEYTESVERLLTHLKDTFDFGGITAGVQKHISEGIMHAMETAHKYHTKMISICGEIKSMESSDSSAPVPIIKQPRMLKLPFADSKDPQFVQQLDIFRNNILFSKGFYRNLPDTVCSSEKFSSGTDEPCWNGHSVGTYAEMVPDISNQQQNPEVKVNSIHQSSLLQLADKLSHFKKKIYGMSGSDEEMMQGDDWSIDDNGSGSSKKYNKKYYGNTVDDEDYEDYSGSGSGHGQYNPNNPPYKTHRRKGANQAPDSEFYLEDENENAYITEKPANHPHGSASNVIMSQNLLILLTGWYTFSVY